MSFLKVRYLIVQRTAVPGNRAPLSGLKASRNPGYRLKA